jgi:hypothetical protein
MRLAGGRDTTTYWKKHKTKNGRVYLVKVTEEYVRPLTAAEKDIPMRLLGLLLPKEEKSRE